MGTISKNEFEAYCEVQESGFTNMIDVRLVSQLSGLTRDQVMFIMRNYSDLQKEHKGETRGPARKTSTS